MKLSTFTSTVIGAALIFASKAVADVDFFDYPAPNAVFRPGKTVQFVVDDLPDGDDGDDRIYADLYRENGKFVKTIRSWWGDDLDDNDEFAFSWKLDNNMSGRYFIELYSDDDDDDDDVSRSFVFEVQPAPRKQPVPSNGGVVRQPTRRPTTVPRPGVQGPQRGAVRNNAAAGARNGGVRRVSNVRRI